MPETPDFSGTWQANLHRCRLVSGAAPMAITARVDHAEDLLRVDMTTTRQDGTTSASVFTCSTNGTRESSTLDGKTIRGKAHWIDDELIIESWLEIGDRELYFCDCWSLTDYNQTLIMEHKDDVLAGQMFVFERVI